MTLSTIDSSNPASIAAVRLMKPEYWAQAPERGVGVDVFTSWASDLYKQLPKSGESGESYQSIAVQPQRPIEMVNATLLKRTFSTKSQQTVSDRSFAISPVRQSDLSSGLGSNMIKVTSKKCAEDSYKRLIIEFKDRPGRGEELTQIKMLLSECFLEQTDSPQQQRVAAPIPFHATHQIQSKALPHFSLLSGFRSSFSGNWSEEIPSQNETQLLIHGLKQYLDRDVEKATSIAKWAVNRFPESKELQKIWRLLSPSKVLTRPASGVSRRKEFEWIKANQNRYRGQWVALAQGQCLASGSDLHSVRERARKLMNLREVLITFLPGESGS